VNWEGRESGCDLI